MTGNVASLLHPSTHLSTGPKTNWIVGTKSTIGVDANTVIIDRLAASGEVLLLLLLLLPHSPQPLYPDASDLSDAVPSLSAYDNSQETLSLPVVDGQQVSLLIQSPHRVSSPPSIPLLHQMTWSDVSWVALYCRKVSMLFMDVKIPAGFA